MRLNIIFFFILAALLTGCTAQLLKVAPGKTATQTIDPKTLKEECDRIEEIYPLLMLAAMMEGPMTCGDPHMGEELYSCDEDESLEENAKRAHRQKVREKQELAAKNADIACDAYEEDMTDPVLEKAARDAVRVSRATDNGKL